MNIFSAIKRSKHYKMEIFSTLFCVLTLCMLFVLMGCFSEYLNITNNALNEQAIYTTRFTTSKTELTGEVIDVFTNEKNTKSLLLLKFDNIESVSTNAANYQCFLTGADVQRNPQNMKCSPSGGIYMFGSTGYMGIYLVNTKGFDCQILDLVVRCNSEIVASVENDKNYVDKSFDKYDQFRVYFNPAGTDAHKLDCLDNENMTIFDLYEEMISYPQEQAIVEKLDSDLQQMYVNLSAIDEYKERLERDGVIVANTPYLIADDRVVSYDIATATSDTPDDPDMSKLMLVTDTTIAGGYNFDWRNGSVREGFLDDLIGESGLSYAQFFAQKSREVNVIDFSTSSIIWYLTDGTRVSDLNIGGDETGEYARLNNDISLLTTAWKNQYNDKYNYQVVDLKSLLLLEVSTRSVEHNSTVNMSENVIIVY